MTLEPTPQQTIGPFFSHALTWDASTGPLHVHGTVTDGDGEPVGDALLEFWDGGRLVRCATDASGRYVFGTYPPTGRCFDVSVFARGLLRRLVTRVYLPEAETDEVLRALARGRRATLVAVPDDAGLRFDVRLQGDGETVFFEL